MKNRRHPVNLEDLTIVLLLTDRDEFAQRWLTYFEITKPNVSLIIADGGPKPYFTLEERNNLPGQIRYFYYGFDKDILSMILKIHASLSNVDTEFVLLSSDDDFYLFDGIACALAELKQDPELHACMGIVRDFSIFADEILVRPTFGCLRFGDEMYSSGSLDQESPIARAESFFEKDESFWHAIYRTDTLKQAHSDAIEVGIEDFALYEFFINLRTSIAGKLIRSSHYLYMLHQVHNEGQANKILAFDKNDVAWRFEFNKILKFALKPVLHDRTEYNFELVSKLRNSRLNNIHSLNLRALLEVIKYRFGKSIWVYLLNHIDPFVAHLYWNRDVKQILRFLRSGSTALKTSSSS